MGMLGSIAVVEFTRSSRLNDAVADSERLTSELARHTSATSQLRNQLATLRAERDTLTAENHALRSANAEAQSMQPTKPSNRVAGGDFVFRVTAQRWNDDQDMLEIDGELTNTGTKNYSFVTFRVGAYDATGELIGITTEPMTAFPGSATKPFRITFVDARYANPASFQFFFEYGFGD